MSHYAAQKQEIRMEKHGNTSKASALRQKAEELLKNKLATDDSQLSTVENLKLIYELQVHQVELELQNEELRNAWAVAEGANDKYFRLYDLAPSGYFTLSRKGEIIELNLAGALMLGKDRSHLRNSRFDLFVSPDSKSFFNLFLKKVFKNNRKESCELTLPTSGNQPVFVHLSGISTESGKQCFVSAVDITEHIHIEKKLKESEETYRTLLHTIPDIVVITDLEGNITYANDQLFLLLKSTSKEKIYGKKIFSFVAEHDLSRAIENTKLMFSGPLGVKEYQLTFEDKIVFDAEVNGDVIHDHTNNPAGMIYVIRDITQRKQMGHALQRSEVKYRQLAENSTMLVYRILLKPELKFDYVSPSATAITGYTPEDHYKDPQLGFKLVHPDDRILLENTTRYSKGEPIELRWIRKDGQVIWTEQRNVLLFDGNNEPYAIEGNASDITDRKNAELGLRKEAERNALLIGLFAKAPGLSDNELYDIALNIAVKITDSKIGFFHQLSDNQQEIILTTWNDEARKNCVAVFDNHYPLDKAGNWADCIRQKKAVVNNDYSSSANRKGLPEGHAPMSRIMSIPVVDDEKVRLIFGVGNKSTDYTDMDVIQIQAVASELHKILEKRKVEKELQESEDRWHFAIEGSNDGIWDWNLLTGKVFFSNRWKEMIGYAPNELEGKLSEWQSRVHPDDIETVVFRLQQHFEHKTPDYTSEHRLLCRDGSWKWILDRGKVMEWTVEGKPARMVGTHTDISERISAEESIKKSEEKFRSIFENMQDAYFEASIDGTILEISPSIEIITKGQYSRYDMIGNPFAEVYSSPEDRKIYFSKLFNQKSVTDYELSVRNKDGSLIPIAVSAVLSYDASGNPVKITGILRDITERKNSENVLNETLRKLNETNLHLEKRVEERMQELRQLSNLQQAILRHAGLAIISTSPEGLIEQFNDAAEEMLGYKAYEVVGIHTPVLFHEPQELAMHARELSLETGEIIPSDFGVFQTILKRSLNQTGEWSYVRKGGDKFPIKLTISSVKDSEGKLLGYIGIAIDITKEKQSISALRESEERFHNMFWAHSAVMILVDPETGEILEANKSAEQYYGFAFNDGPRLLISDLNILSPEQIKEEMEKAIQQNHNYFVFPHKLATGEIRTVEVHSSPIDVKGSKVLFSVIHDITDRKKLYQELIDEKRRLADIIQGTNAGTWEWNIQTGETIFNEQWAQMLGYTLDEISPVSIETWIKFAHPDDLRISGELLEKHFKGELDYYSFESRMKHKNGEWIWVLDRGKVHAWDDAGKPLLMSGTHQDITEGKKAEVALQWNKSFLELMSNSSPLGFLVVDNRNDEILYFNQRFCQIWEIEQLKDQLNRGELKNNDIIPYCLPVLADIPAFAESCKPLQDEANRVVVEDEIAFTENRTVRRFSTQIRGENDEYYGRFYIFEDITKRKRIEADLRKARNEAEKANLAKSEFLSRMSHELRTPMNSILGFAQLMDMGELSPKQKKGVKYILNNGRHLLSLINEVLDISGIEAGRQIMTPEPVKLVPIINEITDSIHVAANKRKISIELIDSPANSLFVLADRLRLKQVLINLLSNAIKYNNEGGLVTINTALQPTDLQGKTQLRISISDTGNGIKPEDIGKLFQAFERIGADKTETEGTGLGLVVVKKLIDAMGGKVGVESEVGTGSTFWIELPLTESHKPFHLQTTGSSSSGLPANKHGNTILYIEDNLSNIELVADILVEHRPLLHLVSSRYGKQTRTLAKEHKPGLILLDLDLPDINGIEVLEHLLADSHIKAIPVIIISADAMPVQVDKLMKAGAIDYLTKPLDVVHFLKTIDRHMIS